MTSFSPSGQSDLTVGPVSRNIGCGSTIPKNLVRPPSLMDVNASVISKNSSNRCPHMTDDSDSDFLLVTNKRTQRKIRKSKDDSTQCSLNNPVFPVTTDVGACQRNPVGVSDVNSNEGPVKTFTITNESQRFALSRFPFPAFTIRFNSGSLSGAQVKAALTEHCMKSFQKTINIIHCRVSKRIPNLDYYDCFIFVQDAFSFSFLLIDSHWPNSFRSE